MDINQDHQELSQTKPYHTKLAHKIIYSISWWTMYIGEAFPTKCMQHKIQRCLYIMIHMQCKCKHAQKESYTYATQGALTPLKRPKIHHFLSANEWKLLDLGAWWKYQLAGHVWVHGWRILPFLTLSLRKRYLTSICLVLEWSTEFFAILMALVLSHRSGKWVFSSPKSLMVYVIQRSWEQQLVATMYSASVVDWATLDCLREDQDTKEEPKNWQVLEVDLLSNSRQNPCLKNCEAPKKKT
jgi:hypothetical protein